MSDEPQGSTWAWAPAARPSDGRRPRGHLMGRVYPKGIGSLLWLAFLYYPVAGVLQHTHEPVRRACALTAIALFALVYVAGWLLRPRLFDEGFSRRTAADTIWPFAAGFALLILCAALSGISAVPLTVYLSTMAAYRLPRRVAVLVLAVDVAAVLASTPIGADTADVLIFCAINLLAFWGVTVNRSQIEAALRLERSQEEVALLRVAAERERVARDVHDVLGHSLTVVAIKAQLAGRLLEQQTPEATERARQEVADVEQLARQGLADVRSTVGGLRAPVLEDELAGCRAALRAAGIEALVEGTPSEVPPRSRELYAWVVREAVTNVVRHSGARRCRISLRADGVSVTDDGRGLDPGALAGTGGHGLRGLRERVDAAGATLVVDSAAGGTRVEVREGSRSGVEGHA